jgi:hypothetical protein
VFIRGSIIYLKVSALRGRIALPGQPGTASSSHNEEASTQRQKGPCLEPSFLFYILKNMSLTF